MNTTTPKKMVLIAPKTYAQSDIPSMRKVFGMSLPRAAALSAMQKTVRSYQGLLPHDHAGAGPGVAEAFHAESRAPGVGGAGNEQSLSLMQNLRTQRFPEGLAGQSKFGGQSADEAQGWGTQWWAAQAWPTAQSEAAVQPGMQPSGALSSRGGGCRRSSRRRPHNQRRFGTRGRRVGPRAS